MDAILQSLYTGLPVLIMHFIATILILVLTVMFYIRLTPLHEFELIKEGNVTAAISASGALLGFAVPLAFCMASSINIYDIIIWGAAILIIQLITYFIIDFLLQNIAESIKKQEMAPVIFLVAVKLTVGFISAAAIAG